MSSSSDLASFVNETAQILLIAFYVILFGIPIARWIIVRYTAMVANASQSYVDSLSAKVRRGRARLTVRRSPRLAPAPCRLSRSGQRFIQCVLSSRPPTLRRLLCSLCSRRLPVAGDDRVEEVGGEGFEEVVTMLRCVGMVLAVRSLDVPRIVCRRGVLCSSALLWASDANAVVKGSAPPPKASRTVRKCRDIDECEAAGELREQEAFKSSPFETTSDGVRFRDIDVGDGDGVGKGDEVKIKYRVMRLGKRSSDNLSGEASPVFSLGYGEDDDSAADALTAKVGTGELIEALDSALVGMRPNGKRRLFVVPEKGWKKINAACTAESNGALNTGEASAGGLDVLGQAVVPLAQVVDNDACIEERRQPQPRNFGARRRLARRFDEGLLIEVELVTGSKTR